MKKKINVGYLSLALIGILLIGCSNANKDNTNNDETEIIDGNNDVTTDDSGHYEVKNEREIVVSDLPSLEIGDLIDFDEYISIIPGDNESASEKQDLSYSIELLNSSSGVTLERVDNLLTSSNTFRAINRGLAGILIKSHGVSKEVYLYVNTASEINTIVNYFADFTESNYTVERGYYVDEEFDAIEIEPVPYFYRTDNYFYNLDNTYGYFKYGDVAYQYSLDSVDDESSFYPYFYESTSDRVTSTIYNNSFRTFANIFTSSNITYSEEVATYYGETYAYGIPSDSSSFSYLLNALGLGTSVTIGGYSLAIEFISPIIDEQGVSFYVYCSTSPRGRVLLGPITLTNIGSTSVEVLEEVINDEEFGPITIEDSILSILGNFSSYTATVTGNYFTEDGEPYTPRDTYLTYNPNNLNLSVTVTNDSIKYSNISYVLRGYEQEGTIKVGEDNTTLVIEELDNLVYYEGEQELNSYKDVEEFSYYDLSNFFSSVNFINVYFYQGENGTLRATSFLNDAMGDLLSLFVPLTSSIKLFNSGGPFAYYIDYSYVDIEISSDLSSISGSIKTTMSLSGETVYYLYTFSIGNFGNE